MAWLLPGLLAFGSLPREGDSQRFHQLGIRSVLTLCAAQEGDIPADMPQQFDWLRVMLPDSRYAARPDATQMARAVCFIHTQVSQKTPVYVHCLAGIERSPAVCIAYLCCHQDLELWEAIHQVKQVRPQVLLTEVQLQAIRQLIP
ncbi:dual specificity protein phosphatase [Leptolyngbya sp. NM2-A1]|nr:dual specificity protein phosphatase family protein [Leptolyngbya sp. FACHB-16]